MSTTAGVLTKGPHSERFRLFLAIILCTSVLPATFLWAPAVALELAQKVGLSPTQIGGLFSLELLCGSLASLPAFLWLKIHHWRRLALLFMALYIAANLASAWLLERSIPLFLVTRAFAALASGSLLILCTRCVALLSHRGRAFGSIIFIQLILGTAGIALLPFLFKQMGSGAGFSLQGILMLLFLPAYRYFPQMSLNTETTESRPKQPISMYSLLSVVAIFLLYTCLGGIWTFIGALKQPNGLDDGVFDHLLTTSSAIGILGAGVAMWLGKDQFRFRALLIGFSLLAGSLLLMTLVKHGATAFSAVLGFKFAWTFIVPFMLTVVSLHDQRGGLINTANLMVGMGLAVGPALCGYLLEYHTYQALFAGGSLLALAAMAAVILSDLNLHKKN